MGESTDFTGMTRSRWFRAMAPVLVASTGTIISYLCLLSIMTDAISFWHAFDALMTAAPRYDGCTAPMISTRNFMRYDFRRNYMTSRVAFTTIATQKRLLVKHYRISPEIISISPRHWQKKANTSAHGTVSRTHLSVLARITAPPPTYIHIVAMISRDDAKIPLLHSADVTLSFSRHRPAFLFDAAAFYMSDDDSDDAGEGFEWAGALRDD